MKGVILFMSILTAAVTVDLSAEARSAKVEGAPTPAAAVAIRTYNYAALSAGELAAARSEAGHIFMRAGISLAWTECRVPNGDAGAPCTEPLLVGRDLMLRLVDRIPVSADRIVALGESMLDREQRGGVLMTIDLFPVRAVAGRASTSWPTLLGRAIAHEIGHLLLGSAEHPRLGLMRALWSHDELRGRKPAHWGFSAREAAHMRQMLRKLSRTPDRRQG
jgi:hypothetical protein